MEFRTTAATETEKTEAAARLKAVMPHLVLAATMAGYQVPDGKIGLAIVVTRPDKSGQVVATFEIDNFLRDIETLVGPVLDYDEEDVEAEKVRRVETKARERLRATPTPTKDFFPTPFEPGATSEPYQCSVPMCGESGLCGECRRRGAR